MSRQAIAFGPGGPVFINETGTRQAITAAGLFLRHGARLRANSRSTSLCIASTISSVSP
jgi:hypothetical protein